MSPDPRHDIYRFDELLTQDECELRDRVRGWVDDAFLPRVNEFWSQGSMPGDLFPELGRLGVLGTSLSAPGCPGRSARATGIAMRELERGDSGLRTFASVQGSLAMKAISLFGDDAQRTECLPAMARGELLGCFGLSEPSAGSNPGGMDTTARHDGDDWVIDGTKKWIGNADIAHRAVIWAQTTDHGDPKGIRGFLVDTSAAGYHAIPMDNKYSLRCGRTCTITLDAVRVPRDGLLPGSEIGLRAPLTCLDQARFGIVWGVLGAVEACLDEALAYAGTRTAFDRQLASYQLVQDKLASMLTELTRGQALAARLSELFEAGEATGEQISLAKQANVETAQLVARTARELLGGVGILDEFASMRHMINLESVATYEGTRDIHRLALGRWLTGIQAFR